MQPPIAPTAAGTRSMAGEGVGLCSESVGSCHGESRNNDIFPLPYLHERDQTACRSRRSQQRQIRRLRVEQSTNEAIWALNQFGTSGVSDLQSENSARSAALDRIYSVVERDRPPVDVASPVAAWRSLQSGTAARSYDDPSVEAAFSLDLLSLPLHAGTCTLQGELEGSDFDDLREFEQRLFVSQEDLQARVRQQGRARCHWATELREILIYILNYCGLSMFVEWSTSLSQPRSRQEFLVSRRRMEDSG